MFYRYEDHFIPKSCVQGICVAAEKDRERKNKKKKTKEVPAVKKNVAETKKRKRKNERG
jgi:hypothetical protein